MSDLTHEQMALILLQAGWTVTMPLRPHVCRHARGIAAGSLKSDGSGSSSFQCPDCGVSHHLTYGPRQAGLGNVLALATAAMQPLIP